MKVLTVISGLLLALGGGFCFLFSTSAFAALAFVTGAIMFISGMMLMISYAVALKAQPRLPETVLVEGLTDILLGFAVLNNQVDDAMLASFFGAWLTFSGVIRLSQSISVSRHSPRDWGKIIPLGLLSSACGVIMLMKSIIEPYNPVALIGVAFLLNAISQLIYALYMSPHMPKKRQLEAKTRAEAKAAAERERLEKKAALKGMTRAERIAFKASASVAALSGAASAASEEEPVADDCKKNSEPAENDEEADDVKIADAAVRKQMAAHIGADNTDISQNAAGNVSAWQSVNLTEEKKSEDIVTADKADPASECMFPESEISGTEDEGKAADKRLESAEPEPAEAKTCVNGQDAGSEDAENSVYSADAEHAGIDVRPTWHKPVDIPSLRSELIKDDVPEETEAENISELRLTAVNLEELESGGKEVVFEKPELPEPELASAGGEASLRREYIDALEKAEEARHEDNSFTALKLEDLIPEMAPKSVSLEERETLNLRLTTSFVWPVRVEKKP